MKRMFATTVLLLVSTGAMAGYKGPQAPLQRDIAAVLAEPVDNQGVQLRGYLVEKLSHEKYWFSDGQHKIRVEIEPEDFPAAEFDEQDLIEIHGEVEKDFLESPEIDVELIRIVTAQP
jgi:uncharacterized protein (TIGR00156 family)